MATADGAHVKADGPRRLRFTGTLFEAALDAAVGFSWPREHQGMSGRWWSTQLRHLALATYIVGVASDLSVRERDEIADVLRVDALTLREQADRLLCGDGYQARGRAVCTVLDVIPEGRFLADRLLETGYATKRWGAPHRWSEDIRALRRRPFRSQHVSDRRRYPP